MRTTLDIPADIMNEAQQILGFKSKTDVVIVALRELIRRRRIEELKGLGGRVPIEVDLEHSRRRPQRRRRS
jgi:Arc/MetJ family transcription regulator